jgi:N-acetylmuramoyl-L-alanine amidase
MKLIKWLLHLFKIGTQKPEASATVPPIINPEPPTKEEVENFPTKKRRIAIARGHGGNDGGAYGQGTSEVEYNTWVMNKLEKHDLDITIHFGGNSVSAMASAILALPDLIIQMHLNSADSDVANGCEVLVIKDDVESYKFAEEFAANFNAHFSRSARRASTRGKKILESEDRGAASLRLAIACPKILVEPFFISNKDDFLPKEKYLEFLIKQFKEWGA